MWACVCGIWARCACMCLCERWCASYGACRRHSLTLYLISMLLSFLAALEFADSASSCPVSAFWTRGLQAVHNAHQTKSSTHAGTARALPTESSLYPFIYYFLICPVYFIWIVLSKISFFELASRRWAGLPLFKYLFTRPGALLLNLKSNSTFYYSV